MSKLYTVDLAGNSEKLIEATPEQLQADLAHPITRVYVYVGVEADPVGGQR